MIVYYNGTHLRTSHEVDELIKLDLSSSFHVHVREDFHDLAVGERFVPENV